MSLLRAAEEAREPVDLVFLNDGWIPPERLAIMRSAGEVVAEAQLGNTGSFRRAVAMPRIRSWSVDDLVWFAEDDYLYDRRALAGLVGAAAAMPEADYLALTLRSAYVHRSGVTSRITHRCRRGGATDRPCWSTTGLGDVRYQRLRVSAPA